eukprot:scaffold15022_cov117-Isochrysis_galbana.AAC.5
MYRGASVMAVTTHPTTIAESVRMRGQKRGSRSANAWPGPGFRWTAPAWWPSSVCTCEPNCSDSAGGKHNKADRKQPVMPATDMSALGCREAARRLAVKKAATQVPHASEMMSPRTDPSFSPAVLPSTSDGTNTSAMAPSATASATSVGHSIFSLSTTRPITAAQSGLTEMNMRARADVVSRSDSGKSTLTIACSTDDTAMLIGASVMPRQIAWRPRRALEETNTLVKMHHWKQFFTISVVHSRASDRPHTDTQPLLPLSTGSASPV